MNLQEKIIATLGIISSGLAIWMLQFPFGLDLATLERLVELFFLIFGTAGVAVSWYRGRLRKRKMIVPKKFLP